MTEHIVLTLTSHFEQCVKCMLHVASWSAFLLAKYSEIYTFVHCTIDLWQMLQFQFHERIAQLIYTFPEDATTSTGSLFWSAPKRFPQPLTFDPADSSHVAFAQAGAILKAQVHNIEVPSWAADFSKVGIVSALHSRCPCTAVAASACALEWHVTIGGCVG